MASTHYGPTAPNLHFIAFSVSEGTSRAERQEHIGEGSGLQDWHKSAVSCMQLQGGAPQLQRGQVPLQEQVLAQDTGQATTEHPGRTGRSI
ncbi:hypothetical protein evm_005046 [Chilo suppressalis]|nr:hypothetical protein evm_005046 [Chilo suppressalis]